MGGGGCFDGPAFVSTGGSSSSAIVRTARFERIAGGRAKADRLRGTDDIFEVGSDVL